MKLHVARWGEGPRTAVLVHGATDDHTTWHRVAPHLAGLGFQVLAPDLRGHGLSGRCDSYLLADFAADLIQSLPTQVDVLLGHSLGALAVGVAAAELAPRSLVYVDPPWRSGPLEASADPPPWSEEDQAVDMASLMRTDPALADWIPERMRQDIPSAIPQRLVAPTLVVEPAVSPLVEPAIRDRLLKLGFAFRTVPGVRHVIHRDDLQGFLSVLEEWTLLPIRKPS